MNGQQRSNVPIFDNATALRLQRFLADSQRPEGTLRYFELAGFLFAVASAPENVPPSQWMEHVFNDADPGYRDLNEARSVLGDIMALYNHVNQGVLERTPQLPGGCEVRTPATANFADDAPLGEWARGFLMGHDWLVELWNEYTPAALDEDLGGAMLMLSFFASEKLAEAFRQEAKKPQDLPSMAETVAQLIPEALHTYANLGRSIYEVHRDNSAKRPARSAKTGRNEPCPCGSGKKFKKCCGNPGQHS